MDTFQGSSFRPSQLVLIQNPSWQPGWHRQAGQSRWASRHGEERLNGSPGPRVRSQPQSQSQRVGVCSLRWDGATALLKPQHVSAPLSSEDRTGVVSRGKQCWGLPHPWKSWKQSSWFKCSFLLAFPGKAGTDFSTRGLQSGETWWEGDGKVTGGVWQPLASGGGLQDPPSLSPLLYLKHMQGPCRRWERFSKEKLDPTFLSSWMQLCHPGGQARVSSWEPLRAGTGTQEMPKPLLCWPAALAAPM